VTRQILAEIPEDSETPALPRTEDIAAYDAYLRGRHHRHLFSPDSLVQAIAWYSNSLETDPLYAPAYAGLAEAYTIQSIGFAMRPSRETMPQARDAADKALEREITKRPAECSPSCRTMLGTVRYRSSGWLSATQGWATKTKPLPAYSERWTTETATCCT
jgi:hypothetical protein